MLSVHLSILLSFYFLCRRSLLLFLSVCIYTYTTVLFCAYLWEIPTRIIIFFLMKLKNVNLDMDLFSFYMQHVAITVSPEQRSLVAHSVKHWPTDLAVRIRSVLEAKSFQP